MFKFFFGLIIGVAVTLGAVVCDCPCILNGCCGCLGPNGCPCTPCPTKPPCHTLPSVTPKSLSAVRVQGCRVDVRRPINGCHTCYFYRSNTCVAWGQGYRSGAYIVIYWQAVNPYQGSGCYWYYCGVC